MKSLAVLICVVTAATALSFTSVDHEEWDAFKLEHQKQYDTEQEDQHRMKIYVENKHEIAHHNELFARGLVAYSLKLNKYSDLTHHEFISAMFGDNEDGNNAAASMDHEKYVSRFESPANRNAPSQMDWRKLGAVTDVKDQGTCMSGWAFSATGALEGQHFLATGYLVSLSEQNLIDCSSDYGNTGCKQGWVNKAFNYIKNNEGINSENIYPYEADDGTCRYNSSEVAAYITGYVTIPKNEQKVLNAVADVGPVSATMFASLATFRHYENGVYDDNRCTDTRPGNHGVLIAGYGSDETNGDYWLIKNSWGPSWGKNGYALIARNRNNICGIASKTLYPLV